MPSPNWCGYAQVGSVPSKFTMEAQWIVPTSLEQADILGTEMRQVFDLPDKRLGVTEHRTEAPALPLRGHDQAPLPGRGDCERLLRANYARRLFIYMVGQHLPVARTAELFSQVCGAPVSTGWLAGLSSQAADELSPFLSELRAQLVASSPQRACGQGRVPAGAPGGPERGDTSLTIEQDEGLVRHDN